MAQGRDLDLKESERPEAPPAPWGAWTWTLGAAGGVTEQERLGAADNFTKKAGICTDCCAPKGPRLTDFPSFVPRVFLILITCAGLHLEETQMASSTADRSGAPLESAVGWVGLPSAPVIRARCPLASEEGGKKSVGEIPAPLPRRSDENGHAGRCGSRQEFSTGPWGIRLRWKDKRGTERLPLPQPRGTAGRTLPLYGARGARGLSGSEGQMDTRGVPPCLLCQCGAFPGHEARG